MIGNKSKNGLPVKDWAVLIGVPLILWGFYWYVGFNQSYIKYGIFFSVILLIAYTFRDIIASLRLSWCYTKFVALVATIVFISIFMALFYWDQSINQTYRATVYSFIFLYYFLLLKIRPSLNDLFKIVIVFTALYFVLWLIAIYAAPNVLFGNKEEILNDRGFFRISNIEGLDIVCLLFFISIVNAIQRENKLLWIVLAFASFVLVFLTLSRMLMFSLFFVAVCYIFKTKKTVLLIIVPLAVVFGGKFLQQNEITSNLIEMTQSQLEDKNIDNHNLRLVEYTNATKVYPFHIGTFFMGNGKPHVESAYGQREESLKNSMGFNRSDSGYVDLFTSYGIISLLLFLVLLYYVFKHDIRYTSNVPFKLFIIALFINNLTDATFFGFGIAFMISLYCLQADMDQQDLNVIE